jgi:hypothetical protein
MKFGVLLMGVLEPPNGVKLAFSSENSSTPLELFAISTHFSPRISFGAIHVEALSGFLHLFKRCG